MPCYPKKYRANTRVAGRFRPNRRRDLLQALWQFTPTLLLVVLATALLPATARAQYPALTAEEQAWLKQHPVIRIGIDAAYAPYSFVDNKNRYAGVAPDLLALIEKRLNIRFEPVAGLSWSEIVDAARLRRLDVIATAVITEQRKSFLNFSQIYIPTPLVIMTRHDDERVKQRDDLRQLRVALVEGYSSSQQVLTEYPSIKPHMVATALDGLRAVAAGEADAYVGVLGINIHLSSQHGISNLKVAARYNVETNGQRLAVRRDWPQLVRILDKALNDISPAEKLTIMRKWIPVKSTVASTDKSFIALSEAEEDFLASHPVIRVANEMDWPPFDFVDEDGMPAGFSIDYFKLVASKLGLRINWVNGYSWNELLQEGIRHEIDAFPAIISNPQRERHFLFSEPYHQNISAYFMRKGRNIHDINDPEQLKNYRLALVAGFDDYRSITTHYPGVTGVTVNTVLDALKAVLAGDADIFICDISVCNYLIEKHLLRGLYQAGRAQLPELREGENLRFAVRKDWPELLSLLKKGMQAVSQSEIQALRQRWVEIPTSPLLTRERLIALVAMAALLILLFIIAWVWGLRRQRDQLLREVGQQTQALHENERRLSLALEGGGMAAFDMDYESGEIVVSKGWWSMMGLVDADTPNPRERWLSLIHPDDRDVVLGKAAAYMHGELKRFEVEYRLIPQKGILRWQVARGAALGTDSDGRPSRMVGLVQDITQHKELERIKDEFIASVSHELRTPLTSIKGALGLVTGGATGQLPAQAEHILKIAQENSERLNLLINDLLDMEKLRAGQMEFHMAPLTINELLQDAVQANQGYAEKYNVHISLHTAEDHTITGDKNRLLQVMANLISNAAKFSPPGGEIKLDTKYNKHLVRVTVRDEGQGIPDEFQGKIFERFSQADNTNRQGKGGTGLGLAISKEIIERHDGQIGFHSKPGQGTAFYFELAAQGAMQQIKPSPVVEV